MSMARRVRRLHWSRSRRTVAIRARSRAAFDGRALVALIASAHALRTDAFPALITFAMKSRNHRVIIVVSLL